VTTKFLLTLLAVNGLLLSPNSASAYSVSEPEIRHDIPSLSRTIAESIDLGGDYHSLISIAIDRALIAQQVKDIHIPHPVTAGVPMPQMVRGQMAKPQEQVDRPNTENTTVTPDEQKPPTEDQLKGSSPTDRSEIRQYHMLAGRSSKPKADGLKNRH
jgi:hypothetical protein